jgi:hypothetical protein
LESNFLFPKQDISILASDHSFTLSSKLFPAASIQPNQPHLLVAHFSFRLRTQSSELLDVALNGNVGEVELGSGTGACIRDNPGSVVGGREKTPSVVATRHHPQTPVRIHHSSTKDVPVL